MSYLSESQVTSRAQARAHAVLRRRYPAEYTAAYQQAKIDIKAETEKLPEGEHDESA